MDRFNCTREELAKTLTNSVRVKMFPPLGGPPIMIRVYYLSPGEYVSVFERPPTEPALPPLECAAAFSAEPPTAPALATQNPPTTPPAASPGAKLAWASGGHAGERRAAACLGRWRALPLRDPPRGQRQQFEVLFPMDVPV